MERGNVNVADAFQASTARGRRGCGGWLVRQFVAGKGFLFADLGDHKLRGFEDPVRVFELKWREYHARRRNARPKQWTRIRAQSPRPLRMKGI